MLQPLSGFRDYSKPTKNWLIRKLSQEFEAFGFAALETPILEKAELLSSEYGEEAQKLLYLFEDNGGRAVGLRYDLTLPLARYAALNWAELPKPFKRYEIGPVFRGERAQRGRLRQFYQADADIIGANSEAAIRELFLLLASAQSKIGLNLSYAVNDRRIITAALEKLEITNTAELLRLLDKKEKLSEEQFSSELRSLGYSEAVLGQISQLFLGEDTLEEFRLLLNNSDQIKNIEELLKFASQNGIKAAFDPSMVRGLDYYTGFIVEGFIESDRSLSLVGGGQYDSLIGKFNPQAADATAVGFSFGVDRIVDYIDSQNSLVDPTVFLINYPDIEGELTKLATKLRSDGKKVELYLDATVEAGKQLKYASRRGYKTALIATPEAWKERQVVVKDMDTGAEKRVDIENV